MMLGLVWPAKISNLNYSSYLHMCRDWRAAPLGVIQRLVEALEMSR